METTYTLRAADGQEYGPATLDQLIGWVREARVNQDTELRRSDMQHWSRAGDFTELQSIFQSAPAAVPATLPQASAAHPAFPSVAGASQDDPVTIAQLKSGASWFYWIAGMSLINSIAAASGSDWRFIVGLGATQIFDAVGAGFGGAGKIVTLALDLLVVGLLVLFGIFGNKRHLWAFIVGMGLFALDTLVFLFVQDWIGVAFHVFVLFCLFRGFAACRALRKS